MEISYVSLLNVKIAVRRTMAEVQFLWLLIWCFLCILHHHGGICHREGSNICHIAGQQALICENAHSMDDLSEGLQSVDSSQTTELLLSNLELIALPSGLLQGTNFTKLRIEYSILPFLALPGDEPSPFAGATSVYDLTVDGVSYPYNWKWMLLNDLANLNTLRVINSDFLIIPPSFKMINISSIKVIVIQNSQVRWINDEAFASLPLLSSFHFIGNKITVFRRSYLPRPGNFLSLINLKQNCLLYLEDDIFAEMPNLVYVNLEDNKLATLSEGILSGEQRQKTSMDIAGNPFICNCSINWMKKRARNLDIYKIQCIDPQQQKVFYRDIKWDEMNC